MKIIKSEDMKKDKHFNILIYAKPGTGKTSTIKYLEGKTLILDIDHTSQVLSGLPNISVVKIDTDTPIKHIQEFFKYAKDNVDEYDNIVIDNLTHYQKLYLMERGEHTKSGMPELKDYAIFDTHLLNLITSFNSLDTNIVYTAWETTVQIQMESGQLFNQFLPDIRHKVVNHVMGIVPVVARLVKSPETNKRGFILSESNGIFSKNQLDNRKFALQSELFKIGDIDETKDDDKVGI